MFRFVFAYAVVFVVAFAFAFAVAFVVVFVFVFMVVFVFAFRFAFVVVFAFGVMALVHVKPSSLFLAGSFMCRLRW